MVMHGAPSAETRRRAAARRAPPPHVRSRSPRRARPSKRCLPRGSFQNKTAAKLRGRAARTSVGAGRAV